MSIFLDALDQESQGLVLEKRMGRGEESKRCSLGGKKEREEWGGNETREMALPG